MVPPNIPPSMEPRHAHTMPAIWGVKLSMGDRPDGLAPPRLQAGEGETRRKRRAG